MNFIPTWLRPFHYRIDPYSCPQAENLPEEIIKSLVVFSVFEPRFSNPELNILNYPASTVIHGWGKTMGLRWLMWWAKQKREVEGAADSPLVVPYTHFQPLLMQNPPYFPQHHAAPLMTAFAMAFLMMLNEVGFVFMNQPTWYRENWWAFLNQYLPAGWYQVVDWNSENLPKGSWSEMQSFRDRRLALDGELDQSLLVLASWLQEIGIKRIYIGIDNLTGYGQTKDDGQAAQLITPLIETDQLFHIQGLYWKILISDAMREKLAFVPENRPLRYKVFPIRWDQAGLLEMVNKTFKECADPPLNDLNGLTDRFLNRREPPVASELADLAMRSPGSPPQNMLMFINELLQRVEMAGSDLITEEIALGYLDEIKQAIMPPGALEAGKPEEPAQQPGQEIAVEALARELDELENQHDQRDYVHYVVDCSAQMRKIQDFQEKVDRSLQKVRASQKTAATAEEAQALLQKIAALEPMAQRARVLNEATETICFILDVFPQDNRDWAARALYTIDQEYIDDVKLVLTAGDRLPQEQVLPLLEAVQQVRLTPHQAANHRGQLVEEGKRAIAHPESRFRMRVNLSILITPLLLSLAVGPVFDDPLRENWQKVVQFARQNVN